MSTLEFTRTVQLTTVEEECDSTKLLAADFQGPKMIVEPYAATLATFVFDEIEDSVSQERGIPLFCGQRLYELEIPNSLTSYISFNADERSISFLVTDGKVFGL